MGDWYTLDIGGYNLLSNKGGIEDEVLTAFREADRRRLTRYWGNTDDWDGGPPDVFYVYESTARHVMERLEVMGFTLEACREDFEHLLNFHQSIAADALEISGARGAVSEAHRENAARIDRAYSERCNALLHFTFADWLQAVRRLRSMGIRHASPSDDSSNLSPLERVMVSYPWEHEWYSCELAYPCSDIRFLIRAYLETVGPDERVILDYSDFVPHAFSEDEELATMAIISSRAPNPVDKVLLLTEGPSDSAILHAAVEKLYPHLADFYSVLDFSTFSIEGGAGNLLTLVKGLASCGISNRLVAVFDSDTAGKVLIQHAAKIAWPKNIRIMQLPHLKYAEAYPTVGPTGESIADVNGLACSIEMYLGLESLRTADGGLMPIMWSAYNKGLCQYQGALVHKERVRDLFLHRLASAEAESNDPEFDAIKAVLGKIFRAFTA